VKKGIQVVAIKRNEEETTKFSIIVIWIEDGVFIERKCTSVHGVVRSDGMVGAYVAIKIKDFFNWTLVLSSQVYY